MTLVPDGVHQIASGRRAWRSIMSRTRSRTDLFTVIEVLQRRLERAGLSAEVVDAAITRAVSEALGAPRPAKA
jgi:hypothetical protein